MTISDRHNIGLPGVDQDHEESPSRPPPEGDSGAHYSGLCSPNSAGQTKIRWVKAHPELDKNKSGRWSCDDFGIWLSHEVAGKEMEGTYWGKTISSWSLAGRLYGTNKLQSVNVDTCTKIIYDKHLHGGNLAKMGPIR